MSAPDAGPGEGTAIPERVARGAALLDARRPGWAAEIDRGTLDLGYGETCILGQVFGRFGQGARTLGLERRGDKLAALGFDITMAEWPETSYRALTAAWLDALAARRTVPS